MARGKESSTVRTAQRICGASVNLSGVAGVYEETWLRVVRHGVRYNPDYSFATWLFASQGTSRSTTGSPSSLEATGTSEP